MSGNPSPSAAELSGLRVNVGQGAALFLAQRPEVGPRRRATGGGSTTIVPSRDAWDMYMSNPRLSNVYLDTLAVGEGALQLNSNAFPDLADLATSYILATAPEPQLSFPVMLTGTSWEPSAQHPSWLKAFEPVNVHPVTAHRSVLRYALESRDNTLAEIRRRLDRTRLVQLQKAPTNVLKHMTDELGVGQLGAGRAIGVTPTAIRKWRRGEPIRPEHRDRLAQFAALLGELQDAGIYDPAGWISIPVSAESFVTPIHMFTKGRGDLAVLLGAGAAEPQEVLDLFDPHWRTRYAVDPDYDVVTLLDGSRSAVPRRDA